MLQVPKVMLYAPKAMLYVDEMKRSEASSFPAVSIAQNHERKEEGNSRQEPTQSGQELRTAIAPVSVGKNDSQLET